VLEETFDSAGGAHITEHFNPQGVSGIDLTTGAKYQANGMNKIQENFTANGLRNFTLIDNFKIIGQGPENNYTVHQTLHFTISANGVVTANHDNFKIDQGSGG
jgi:hypothetical protein